MHGEAIAHGAATLVNAISTGRGAAVGVSLWTKARVELNRDVGKITATIQNEPHESLELVSAVVRRVLHRYKVSETYGAHVETISNIPIARGMKSSSVAANAVAIATTTALGKKIQDKEILEDSVEAAIKAGVTITGAFDDASASYYGGIVVTDNKKRKILKRAKVSKDYCALFHVPSVKSYTAKVDLRRIRKLASIAESAHRMALLGQYWEALTLNGLAHSIVLGWEPMISIDALDAGAVASGLSGKGPATVAIVKRSRASEVRSAMARFEGKIIEAQLSNRKASAIVKHT